MMSGTLYGIGAGPGDPELITLQGLRLLRAASVVFVPATAADRSYAATIVEQYLDRSRQQIVELVCPPYRDRSLVEARWSELAEQVATALGHASTGAFVCEGDPSLFSTFVHLRNALSRRWPRIAIQTVPGITAVTAAAAAANVPLAMWDERLVIAPAAYEGETAEELLEFADNVAILKPGAALASILGALERRGDERAILVRRVGRPEQQIVTDVAAMADMPPDYFTTLLVRRNAK